MCKNTYRCIDWAKHRQRKAAVKVHMVANVANRLPHFCVFGKANDHDSKKEDELFSSLKDGDIGIADRAYNHFKALYRQTTRGVFFVVREKADMKHRVVKKVPKKDLGANIRLPLKSLVKIIAKARLFNLHVQRFEFLAESD